jgi:hypothetical protein
MAEPGRALSAAAVLSGEEISSAQATHRPSGEGDTSLK